MTRELWCWVGDFHHLCSGDVQSLCDKPKQDKPKQSERPDHRLAMNGSPTYLQE